MLDLTINQGVLLRNAVAPLAAIDEIGVVVFSLNKLVLSATESSTRIDAMVEIESSMCSQFQCNENAIAHFSLYYLFQFLTGLRDEDSITIVSIDDPFVKLLFVVRNHGTGEILSHYKILLVDRISGFQRILELPDQSTEYQVKVSLIPGHFITVITDPCLAGKKVVVTITDSHVMLSADNVNGFLYRALGQCVIEGASNINPVYLILDLSTLMTSFLTASAVSSLVEISYSNVSPPKLNFRVGVGNITFFFLRI